VSHHHALEKGAWCGQRACGPVLRVLVLWAVLLWAGAAVGCLCVPHALCPKQLPARPASPRLGMVWPAGAQPVGMRMTRGREGECARAGTCVCWLRPSRAAPWLQPCVQLPTAAQHAKVLPGWGPHAHQAGAPAHAMQPWINTNPCAGSVSLVLPCAAAAHALCMYSGALVLFFLSFLLFSFLTNALASQP